MTRKKKGIWYQVEDRQVTSVKDPPDSELTHLCAALKENSGLNEPVDSLILQAKKKNDAEYTTLNEDFFQQTCDKNFRKLVTHFGINQSNPIRVTFVDTSKDQEVQELRENAAEAAAENARMTQELRELKEQMERMQLEALTRSTSGQAQSNEIWVRHNNNRPISIEQNALEVNKVTNVGKLKWLIKFNFEISKDITLYKDEEVLDSEIPIYNLYNTENEPLEVVVVDDLTDEMTMREKEKNTPDFKFASLAFNHSFENTEDFVGHFRHYINECHRISKDTYMPYIAIIQSSGYGKSRLIKEYAREVYTLYLNLGIGRNCFPRPSTCAKDFINSFEKSKDPELWFTIFLAKAISLIREKRENDELAPSQFWDYHLNDNGESIWQPAIDAANSTDGQQQLDSVFNNAGYLKTNFNDNDESDIKILLCVDEGRTLLQHEK